MIKIKEVKVKNNKHYSNHEKVFYFEDPAVSLKGYVAWHNTQLGPATGGTRFFKYKSTKDALDDVLKLSEAMTYKCAFAGVPFGGGKATICAPVNGKTKSLMKSYAQVINYFAGKYTTGTDVGISDSDTKFMSQFTPFILKGTGGKTTTSLMGGRGVYEAIKSATKIIFPKLKNKEIKVAVKGVGKMGAEITRLLVRDGYQVYVADKDKKTTQALKKKFPKITIVPAENIHTLDVDVYCPCAMGGEFNKKTIKQIKARIIAGGANNQFEDVRDIEKIHNLGICYIPDYVANAGGLIQITDEIQKGGYQKKRVEKRIKQIGLNVAKLIKQSRKYGRSVYEIAKDITLARIKQGK